MGNGDAGFGQDFFQSLFAVLNGVYFVVQKVNLPAAFEFAQHRFANHAIAFSADKGLDCQTALRRGGDDAHVAQTFECHTQRARNRRGSQCQHINLGAHGFHGLFVAHTKAVLFVDDEQA